MEFYIKFESKDYWVTHTQSFPKGLYLLDKTRELFDLPSFPIEKVLEPWRRCESEVHVQLTEDQARRSGHFDSKYNTTVEIPKYFLNQYITLEPNAAKCCRADDGGFAEIQLRYALNKAQLVSDWAKAGHPLNWDCE